MLKKIFSKNNILRFCLFVGAITVIMFLLPRADHSSITYELNQPWKYQLLTAEFDMPILRDSVSIKEMRDSIDRTFVPFVKKNDTIAKTNIERFNAIAGEYISNEDRDKLSKLIAEVYERGILEAALQPLKFNSTFKDFRMMDSDDDNPNSVIKLEVAPMLSPRQAFVYIDSVYDAESEVNLGDLPPQVTQAININLTPNVTVDTLTDYKFRSQEYLTVTGALGVIKQGQRIVDRGEIITPQIYTNLNTYQEKLAQLENTNNREVYFLIGQGLYLVILFTSFYIYLRIYRKPFFSDTRKMTFLMTFITIFAVFAILMFEYVTNGLYIVPFAAVPVIILVFFDSRTAIFSLIMSVLVSALVATYPFEFIFNEIIVGLIATYSIWQLSRRSQLLMTALYTFVTYCLIYFTFCLITNGDLEMFSWKIIGLFGINTVILSFAYVLIFLIEKLFGFTSMVTLVELSDINNPLLRRLAEEAPGTFQHSIQVSTIAAEAARAINANTTLVRTGALYHDIGKLKDPIYFTENQHGVNPHSELDPVTSAKKIISHISDGVAMANHHNLPSVLKSFIREHHGKGMAKYFYTTAVNQNPDKVIDKADFSYPGPNPQSVETVILMMADSIEAASRSLQDYSPESIDRLVENIINGQIADGLYKESPITFKDVEVIKKVFKSRLATIYHTRIRYPDMKKDTATAKSNQEKESV